MAYKILVVIDAPNPQRVTDRRVFRETATPDQEARRPSEHEVVFEGEEDASTYGRDAM